MWVDFEIEQRVREGRPTALLGALSGAPVVDPSVEWVFVNSSRAPLATLMNLENQLAKLFESARRSARRVACVVVRSVDAADEVSLELFRQLVLEAAVLAVPVFFQFTTATPVGKAKALLEAIERVEGEHGVIGC